MEKAKKIEEILEIHPVKKGLITRREYEWLKTFEQLEPHEIEKIKEFEESLLAAKTQNKNPKEKTVFIDGLVPDKKTIFKGFLQSYKLAAGFDFIQNKETLANLEPILKYFIQDESFFECSNLVKKLGSKTLENSFDKGLLIIGNYGNGKTSIMKAFEILFKKNYEIAIELHWKNIAEWQLLRFKAIKSHEMVTEFETINTPEAKENFYKKYSGFRFYIDDVKKEKVASNYGKTEIVREIIEKRYDKRAKTFITCNYQEEYPNDLEQGLIEFGTRYGGHIYDRVFEMYNVIEFKGKSMR